MRGGRKANANQKNSRLRARPTWQGGGGGEEKTGVVPNLGGTHSSHRTRNGDAGQSARPRKTARCREIKKKKIAELERKNGQAEARGEKGVRHPKKGRKKALLEEIARREKRCKVYDTSSLKAMCSLSEKGPLTNRFSSCRGSYRKYFLSLGPYAQRAFSLLVGKKSFLRPVLLSERKSFSQRFP